LIDEILSDAKLTTALTGIRMPRMNAFMERWVTAATSRSSTRCRRPRREGEPPKFPPVYARTPTTQAAVTAGRRGGRYVAGGTTLVDLMRATVERR
jgi:hypothetical protein